MKVEVDLWEIEKIKAERDKYRKDYEKIKELYDKVDQKRVDDRIRRESLNLFRQYMNMVFRSLGFDEKSYVAIDYNIEHWLGKDWHESEKIHVELCANMTNLFKRAFLEIGVKTEKMVQ